MKTKTNKVPLVGPRGRRELFDKIEELEKKVSELASAQPETHVLEILGTINEGTPQEALALLKLDGETPTLEQMAQIRINNCIVVYDDIELSIVRLLPGDNGTSLVAGEENSTFAKIQVSPDYGTITADDI